MAQDRAPGFEIPEEMRKVAEQSVEQAKRAFDNFADAANQAVGALENKTKTAQAGAKDVSQKAVMFAKENVASSFELAERLVRATDVHEMLRLQTEYVNQQMRALADQAKELGQSASKAAMDTAKPGS
jgi:phasin